MQKTKLDLVVVLPHITEAAVLASLWCSEILCIKLDVLKRMSQGTSTSITNSYVSINFNRSYLGNQLFRITSMEAVCVRYSCKRSCGDLRRSPEQTSLG
mmetsp:Transcript_33070/g.53495  ORF Transcript_33070/g.53495 Transcript_33070/m.53495 type:complete len:99 (+) Transcript_33070:330-626(+)